MNTLNLLGVIKDRVLSYLKLCKFSIMLPVTLTGFTGYFYFSPHFSLNLILVSLGILLSAISASVFNQLQEIEIDRKMARTHNRPLPAGQLKKGDALAMGITFLIAGVIIIKFSGTTAAALICLTTIFWYNAVYTPLKKITAFAVVPGAITGALPPLIGWVAAGGHILDKPAIFIAFLMFTAQVPHFWLLIMRFGIEYRDAGIPSLISLMSPLQISRLTFTWVAASVAAALFLCYFGIIMSGLIIAFLVVVSFLLLLYFSKLLRNCNNISMYNRYSRILDIYFLLILLLLIIDRIIISSV